MRKLVIALAIVLIPATWCAKVRSQAPAYDLIIRGGQVIDGTGNPTPDREREVAIVPNGQPVSLGGSTSRIHELTRHVLGYSERTNSSETELIITATLR